MARLNKKNGVVSDSLTPNIKRLSTEFPEAVRGAVNNILADKKPIVVQRTPIKTGDLRSTIRIVPAQRRGRNIQGGIAAGGGVAEQYAIVQHEDLTFHHEVGQAKFIESVIMESRATFLPDVLDELKKKKVL